ncbi:response regulator transcription factor [Actinokineospora bangkokensis]|uniref:DNA-binding response regulator n=1 Tax=Actinokineospora bangkokensis TaxID=1193682 RepID=A0A1Q9LI08_9PSEU|nr:response regulator transcription factor [Actinokineospora bangkokensis]OLR91668.1 hypothetical protein BJP25_25650 [Actinokineospora bangkokensis]
MELVRLWLVDDHELVTEALAARLAEVADLWVVGRGATDDPDLVSRLERDRPAVVSVDPDTSRVDEGELFDAVRRGAPQARLVVLSGLVDTARVVAAARAGADAWVPKAEGVERVVEVVRGVARGQGWYPPEHLGAVLRAFRDEVARYREGRDPLAALSGREREVLAALVDGLRGPEIAVRLGLSSNTVRTHTHALYGKLGVHSRLAAVSAGRAAGLVPQRGDLPRSS